MEQPKLYARDEICRMLMTALLIKKPLPPTGWSVVKLDQEVTHAGREFEPNLYVRHHDALASSVFYLVDFACRMPDRVNLSATNKRVRQMCGELADEIEQITYDPQAVIVRHGKLKSWLTAILAVQTCWIYREETERVIAEKEEAKRQLRTKQPAKTVKSAEIPPSPKWQSDLARTIFQKVSGNSTENSSAQPSLF